MVIDKEKETALLRYPSDTGAADAAVCALDCKTAFLPHDSLLFSADAARTAGALAMATADEAMLRENLRLLGYDDIQTFGFTQDEEDKIGLCLARREREGELEVAAVLRGTEGREWYSNFDIGYSAEHRGFARAADYAELRLADYVFTRAIGMEPRFFVTGYSRGGAVANILAKRLCDRYGLDKVHAYTFAAPCSTISRRVSRYSSIFNLVRDEDFFTRVPLAGWGYTKYGRSVSLSGQAIDERYRTLSDKDYIGFGESAPVDRFLCAVMTLAPNVHAYYERRRPVGDRRLSLHEFMLSVADMLSSHMDEAVADVFLSAMVSDYADLVSFLSSGADLADMLTSAGGAPRCSVADSHSAAAYMAALELYLDA